MNKKILYVLISLIVLLVCYLTYKYFVNYNVSNSTNNDSNVNSDEVQNIDLNRAYYKGYAYILPNKIFSDLKEIDGREVLHLYSNDTKWGAFVSLIDKSKYEDGLFDDYDKLEKYLKDNSKAEYKNRKSDSNMLVSFEFYGSDNSKLFAYMGAYDNYEYEIMLYDGDDKSMNYDALEVVINVLKTGRKVREQSEIDANKQEINN